MPESLVAGLALVLLGGVFQGSFMYPSKHIKGWAWENYWLIFATTAYVACPWIIAALTVPRLPEVYSGLAPGPVVSTLIFGFGWGLGAVLFGLGVDALGMALGFAVILGITATAGTVIPLIVIARQLHRTPGPPAAARIDALRVVICSFAGRWKEHSAANLHRGSYTRGLAICIGSGLLCACGNLGFAFGADISRRAQSLGATEHLAVNALWVVLVFPMFLCNSGYSAWLLHKNGTAALPPPGSFVCLHSPSSWAPCGCGHVMAAAHGPSAPSGLHQPGHPDVKHGPDVNALSQSAENGRAPQQDGSWAWASRSAAGDHRPRLCEPRDGKWDPFRRFAKWLSVPFSNKEYLSMD
jgi:L-rhamnose-H+ transport protein